MGKLDEAMARIRAHVKASDKGPDELSSHGVQVDERPPAELRSETPSPVSSGDDTLDPAMTAPTLQAHPTAGRSIPIAPSRPEEMTLEAREPAPEPKPSALSEGGPVRPGSLRAPTSVTATMHQDLWPHLNRVDHFNWHPNIEVCRSQTNAAEEVKKLRTNLVNLVDRRGLKSFMITSCKHAEGKSTTALALARSLGGLEGRRVCLIDADMRRPRLKNFLDLKVKAGLDDVVQGDADLAEALIHSEQDQLTVLPTRKGRSVASELLGSERMRAVVTALEDNFDILMFDSPPCLSTTDPIVLGGIIDAAALVVKMNHTPRHSVEHSIALMRQSEVPFIGLILTHHVVHYNTYLLQRYNYYQDYYGYYAYGDADSDGE